MQSRRSKVLSHAHNMPRIMVAVVVMIQFNSIQFNSLLFMCRVNSYKANYGQIIIILQFFIIYVPSQQPQGQLQAQHSVDKNNYFMKKHNIKSKTC
jgi:hypothetical protein